MENREVILIVAVIVVSILLSSVVYWRKKMLLRKEDYRAIKTVSLLSGKEVVEQMLKENDMDGITVKTKDSSLVEYWFSPRTKSITLSPRACYGCGLYEVTRAAHTAAHAIQYEKAYRWIDLFIFFSPLVEVLSRILPFLLILCIYLMIVSAYWGLFAIVSLYLVSLLLVLLMQPVENDASRRAKEWLVSHSVVDKADYEKLDKVSRIIKNYNILAITTSWIAVFGARQAMREW